MQEIKDVTLGHMVHKVSRVNIFRTSQNNPVTSKARGLD